MPPTAPTVPPMPTTVPTAPRGKMSDGNVLRLAENAWCAAVASPITSTAIQTLSIDCAKKIGSTQNAQTSIVSLRAALALQPAFISRDDDQPPATLPTSDSR